MHIYRKFCFHFFSRSYALFELRNLAKMKDTNVFLVSATPLKSLHRITWNFVVIKDIIDVHIHRKFWFHFFLFLNFEFWRKWKILLKQLVSATPLKPLNRISWNFVIMKDIMCRYAYPQDILIPFFSESNAPFWTSKFDENERYYWNSWSAQLHWNHSTELRETL